MPRLIVLPVRAAVLPCGRCGANVRPHLRGGVHPGQRDSAGRFTLPGGGRGLRLLELPRRADSAGGWRVTEGHAAAFRPRCGYARGVEDRSYRHFQQRTDRSTGRCTGAARTGDPLSEPKGHSDLCLLPVCGTTVKCPKCETLLIFHTQLSGVELLCHRCGYTRKMPKKCADCGSDQIRHYGLGSEKVEQEVKSLLPKAGSCAGIGRPPAKRMRTR